MYKTITKGVNKMYRVEWIDDHADFRVKEGFKTSTEAHDWIKKHKLDPVFDCAMVFCDLDEESLKHFS